MGAARQSVYPGEDGVYTNLLGLPPSGDLG